MKTARLLKLDEVLGYCDSLVDATKTLAAETPVVSPECDVVLMLLLGTLERYAVVTDAHGGADIETDEVIQHAKPGIRNLCLDLYRIEAASLDGYPTTSGGERSSPTNELGEVWDASGNAVYDAEGKQKMAPLPARPSDPTARIALMRLEGLENDVVHRALCQIGSALREAAKAVLSASPEFLVDRLKHAAKILTAAESRGMQAKPPPPPPKQTDIWCSNCKSHGVNSPRGDDEELAQRRKKYGTARVDFQLCSYCQDILAKYGRRPTGPLVAKHVSGVRQFDRDYREAFRRGAA